MGILDFKYYFNNALIEGLKTSTIRKHCNFEVGDLFSISPRGVKIDFEVTKINRIRFDEIDNDIAFKEGYRHKDLLLHELESIYKDLTYDTLLYQIEFKRL